MELVHISDLPERSIYGTTGGEFELDAGQSLEIGTKEPPVDELKATVPAGKHWAIRCHVEVIETEAT